MNCKNCGKTLEENLSVCPECGTRARKNSNISEMKKIEEPTRLHDEIRRYKASRKNTVIITSLIVAILIVSSMIVYLLYSLVGTEGKLSLTVDEYPSVTEETSCVIRGEVFSEKKNATIDVDGVTVTKIPAGKDEKVWSHTVSLKNGENIFTITVTDEDGKTASETVTIICNAQVIYRVHSRHGYSDRESADMLCDKIRRAGFEAIVVQVDGLYKVQCGAFSEKKNAEDCVKSLSEKGFQMKITTDTNKK